eukprot:gene8649-10148_t
MIKPSKKVLIIAGAVFALLLIVALGVGLGLGLKKDKKHGPYPVMVVSKLEMVQTHVVPENGLRWELSSKNVTLHLIGNRQTMFLVDLANITEMELPVLEVWNAGEKLGEVALNPPSMLPPTESNGTAYSTTAWSAVSPREWIKPGLSVLVSADNYEPSLFRPLHVGCDAHMDLFTLPIYLFGCTPDNCPPLNQTAVPYQKYIDELYQKWPMATLNPVNHPGKLIQWPYLILAPNGTNTAIKIVNKNQERDGFGTMGVLLSIIGSIRSANGESPTNNQYYSPLIMANSDGKYASPGGGLGTVGGSTGVGDHSYAGIFIHEQGHAFGLPHAGENYPARYPYVKGTVNGSTWGFDFNHNQFLATFVPTSAEYYKNCQKSTVIDPEGRCTKQNVMQGGSGYQAAGYRYTMFADYDMGVMQQYIEGKTVYDPKFPSGYKKWDKTLGAYTEVKIGTSNKGMDGFDYGLPSVRGVDISTIILTVSTAGTADANQVYPLLSFKGNLRRQIDPTDPDQLKTIVPDTSEYPWYCRGSGCDFTLRVTYADNSKRHILLQSGYRPLNRVRDPPVTGWNVTTSGSSFRTIVMNVPATIPVKKVELLDTPMGFNGLPPNAAVLVSRTF